MPRLRSGPALAVLLSLTLWAAAILATRALGGLLCGGPA